MLMATTDGEKNTREAVTVEQKSRGMLVRALGSFLFVAICCAIIAPGVLVSDPPQVIWGVAIVGVVFFGFTGLWSLREMISNSSDSTPAFMVASDGISDHSSALSAGDLRWDEIDQISLISISGQPMVAISPVDVDKYVARQNLLKRVLMRINMALLGAPVAIAPSNLPISRDELVAAIEQYHPVENASSEM